MKTPFRCPVCGGSKILPRGFYDVPAGQEFVSTNYANETCRTCDQNGLVWSEDDEIETNNENQE